MPGDYEVGKGKPPAHSRWRKGQSGNPNGRPPIPEPNAASVVAILDESIAVRQGGAVRKMSAFEVSVRMLVSRALKGDVRAALEFVRLCDKYDVIRPPPKPQTGGVLMIPKDEWLERFHMHGPQPWPGNRSDPPESSESRSARGVEH